MFHDLILPARVSGFYDPGQGAPALLDIGCFWEACQSLSREGRFELLHFAERRSGSYHFAVIRDRPAGQHVQICCNRFFPLLAYRLLSGQQAQQPRDIAAGFADYPELDVFFPSPLQVLRRDFLEIKLDSHNERCQPLVQQLHNEEFAQFAYWQPQIIGEVIYNSWE